MLHSHCDRVHRNFTAPCQRSDFHRIANDHCNPITMLSSTQVRHTTTQNRTLPSSQHRVVCAVVCQLWAWCVWLCQMWACTHPYVVSCVLLVLWARIVELCAYPSVVSFVCIHPFAAMTRNHRYECLAPTWHLSTDRPTRLVTWAMLNGFLEPARKIQEIFFLPNCVSWPSNFAWPLSNSSTPTVGPLDQKNWYFSKIEFWSRVASIDAKLCR